MGSKRIWVARPEPGASRTAQQLRALGHNPLVAPVLTVLPTEMPKPGGPFAGILLTSGQAAAILANAEAGAHGRVFAVGARTAEAARSAGFAHVVSADGDAAALARTVRSYLPPGSSLLHVAGEDRKPEPGASLGAAGYKIVVWEAYAARPIERLPDPVVEALTDRSLGSVLHYSRRSAATALELARSAGLDGAFGMLKHYCLSTDVALPLVEAGLAAHFVAALPSEEALLAGLPPPA